MVFVLTLETTARLYNLEFNISFSLSSAIFCASGCALLYSHVIMVAIANTFPNQRMPYCLYIPSNSFQIEIS